MKSIKSWNSFNEGLWDNLKNKFENPADDILKLLNKERPEITEITEEPRISPAFEFTLSDGRDIYVGQENNELAETNYILEIDGMEDTKSSRSSKGQLLSKVEMLEAIT